jgi:hypothetical protein
MKSKNELIYRDLTVTYFNPGTGEVSDIVVTPQKAREEVVEFHSVNGDKRAPNAYDYVARLYVYPSGSSFGVNSMGKTTEQRFGCYGQMYSFSFKGTDDRESDLYNSALSELNKRAQGGMDLSTDILEYREVIKMFKGAGSIRSYLGNTIRAAQKRGKRPTAETTLKQLVRDAGGNWLQWKLGLSPLLGSFHDVVKEVNTRVVLKTMRVEGKRSLSFKASGFEEENAVTRITSVENVLGKQGVHFRVQFRPADQFPIARWASLNPVGWAWELIPLSFVFDYFVNVGGFLRDSEIALAYNHTFDSGYVTYLYAYSGEIQTRGSLTNFGETKSYNLIGGVSEKRFRREVLASWPFPRAPTFQCNLGSSQLLNIAALLSQLLKR